jgi:hypothetical protein
VAGKFVISHYRVSFGCHGTETLCDRGRSARAKRSQS